MRSPAVPLALFMIAISVANERELSILAILATAALLLFLALEWRSGRAMRKYRREIRAMKKSERR